jgi:hypothetical protein
MPGNAKKIHPAQPQHSQETKMSTRVRSALSGTSSVNTRVFRRTASSHHTQVVSTPNTATSSLLVSSPPSLSKPSPVPSVQPTIPTLTASSIPVSTPFSAAPSATGAPSIYSTPTPYTMMTSSVSSMLDVLPFSTTPGLQN